MIMLQIYGAKWMLFLLFLLSVFLNIQICPCVPEKQQLEALQRQLSSVTSTKTRTVSHKSNKSHASSHSSKARSRRSAKRHVKVKADEEHLKEAIKERSKLITEEEAGEGAVRNYFI